MTDLHAPIERRPEDGHAEAWRAFGEIEELVALEAPVTAALAAERFSIIRTWLLTAHTLLEGYLRDEEARLQEAALEVEEALLSE